MIEQAVEGIEEWFKELLLALFQTLMSNAGEFLNFGFTDGLNDLYTDPQTIVGSSVMTMVNKVTEVAVLPVAYVILSFILCYDLITTVIEGNNFRDFDTAIFFKFVFKCCLGTYLLGNATTIANAFFEIGAELTSNSKGTLTNLDTSKFETITENPLLENEEIGFIILLDLLALLLQIVMVAIFVVIMVVLIGRTMEVLIYCALAPIPIATMTNKELSNTGMNYLKTLGALAFQTILIMIVLGIFSGLMASVLNSLSTDIAELPKGLLQCIAYGVVLCFTLLKTGSIAKSIFQAH